jgi:hypothetical protein
MRTAFLRKGIGGIICGCAEEKMFRSNTGRVVAPMAHLNVWSQWRAQARMPAIRQLPCGAVCLRLVKVAVPLRSATARPLTAAGAQVAENLDPESPRPWASWFGAPFGITVQAPSFPVASAQASSCDRLVTSGDGTDTIPTNLRVLLTLGDAVADSATKLRVTKRYSFRRRSEHSAAYLTDRACATLSMHRRLTSCGATPPDAHNIAGATGGLIVPVLRSAVS